MSDLAMTSGPTLVLTPDKICVIGEKYWLGASRGGGQGDVGSSEWLPCLVRSERDKSEQAGARGNR